MISANRYQFPVSAREKRERRCVGHTTGDDEKADDDDNTADPREGGLQKTLLII